MIINSILNILNTFMELLYKKEFYFFLVLHIDQGIEWIPVSWYLSTILICLAMGRRKAAKKVVKKKKPTVARTFKCLFCNHEDSVSCTLDHKSMTGELVCAVCDSKFQTQINTLTDPIDVFSEWLDETSEKQNRELGLDRWCNHLLIACCSSLISDHGI